MSKKSIQPNLTRTMGSVTQFDRRQLEFSLPQDRIAHQPLPRREDARLLVVDRKRAAWRDASIPELSSFLRGADALVLNDTRVIPAGFTAYRETGGRVDGLFVRQQSVGSWVVLLRHSKRLRPGETLTMPAGADPARSVRMQLLDRPNGRAWNVRIDPPAPAEEILATFGRAPLPPYIRRRADDPLIEAQDRQRYQTVYARQAGAIAAPTAGLHLTVTALEEVQRAGVGIAWLTLHVGPGTFTLITAEHLSDHRMHAEWFDLPTESAALINRRRAEGGRIVAVGTTSARVLETCADPGGRVRPQQGWTDLFIYPPYQFMAVDVLMTNFHLPHSTLLALVMAFAGPDLIRSAYAHAVAAGYRFYSYGDAMLVI